MGKRKNDQGFSWEPLQDNLQKLMAARGLNATKLAAEIGYAPGTVLWWFNGRNPDLISLWVIAKTFHVSIDWLLGLTDVERTQFSDEIKNVIKKYQVATDRDRLIIDTVLSAYDDD